MTIEQIAHLKFLLEILENVDTDILIYGDNDVYLKVDRESANLNVVNYMKYLTKTENFVIDVTTIRDQV